MPDVAPHMINNWYEGPEPLISLLEGQADNQSHFPENQDE